MGFEACDLSRKGLGDVMIDLSLFLAMLWFVAVGLLLSLRLTRLLLMVTDRASFM